MKLRIHFNTDRIIWALMVFLVCSFTIFETYAWGRFVILAGLVLAFGFTALREGLRVRLSFGCLVTTTLLLALYSWLSAMWAITPADATAKGKTLLEISLMLFVLYNSCNKMEDPPAYILSVIKWASYCIVLYSLLFYGLDNLIWMAMVDKRLENDYTNVNTIGMLAAVGIIIQLDEMLREKRLKIAAVFCVPAVFMIAVTQSRKAFLMLIIGVLADIFLRNMHSKDFRNRALKFLLLIGGLILLLQVLLSLSVFSGVMERIESLLAVYLGGRADNSATVRYQMVKAGLEQFLKTPLFGVGMGNTYHVSLQAMGLNSYLHNNFAELLAGGGLFGFLIYYSLYIYLFYTFWKYRKQKSTTYYLCLILVLLFFGMDYGMVSYANKLRYIYLLPLFLEAKALSNKWERGRRAHERHKTNRPTGV